MKNQKRTRWTGVRVVAVLAVTAMALGGALLSGSARAEGTAGAVSGVPTCVDGNYLITWTLTLSSAEPWVLAAATLTEVAGTADVLSAFSPTNVPSGGQSVGQLEAAGWFSGTATLAMSGTYGGGSVSGSGSVTLDGSCAAAPALQVGPSSAGPGEAVTISGTACVVPVGDPAMLNAGVLDGVATGKGGTVTGSVAFTPPLAFGPITAAADGTWSTSVVVPAGTPPGSYAVSASCAFPATGSNGVNAAIFDAVPASVHGQAEAGFAYETKYLTVVSAAKPAEAAKAAEAAEAVEAVPRTTG